MPFRTTSAATLFLAATLIFTGCNNGKSAPTTANFIQGLNSHFLDHNECLFPNTRFPFETSDRDTTRQMDTLVKSGLLDKSEEMSIHASRYTPTPAGARYAPRFCYGHREATAIDNFTPPTPNNGFNETTVTYRYNMMDVPVWAKSADVQAAFPDMALSTSGNACAKSVLAQTPVGWQVPD
jgi:hypothetical protein